MFLYTNTCCCSLYSVFCISTRHVYALNTPSRARRVRAMTALSAKLKYALLFDCDGAIVETEELHCTAYNMAFKKFGLTLPDGSQVEWTMEYCDVFQTTVGGGKPKMKNYFNNVCNILNLILPYFISPNIISSHLISSLFIASHFISFQLISPQLISSLFILHRKLRHGQCSNHLIVLSSFSCW